MTKPTPKPRRRREGKAQASPPAPDDAPQIQSFKSWQTGLTKAEEHVEEILDLMLSGTWGPRTHKLLAEKWGCVPSYARLLAAEANRLLRRAGRDDPDFEENARSRIIANIEAIGQRAMRMSTPPALRVALEANLAYGEYLGVAPAKTMNVRHGRDEFDGMSLDELRREANGQAPRKPAPAAVIRERTH